MKRIGALIISVDEPQLEKCLAAVHNQSFPFAEVIHINNVSPESKAINEGFARTTEKYVMKIDGDFILYPDAMEIVLEAVNKCCPEDNDSVYVHNFRVYDTLYKAHMRGVGVIQASIFKTYRYPNMIGNDRWIGRKVRKLGYVKHNMAETIGTHFEGADRFQIFRRFYCQGVKYGHQYATRSLYRLFKGTGSEDYTFAIRAVEFGRRKREYKTSHNIQFDQKVYEEFLDSDVYLNFEWKRGDRA